jgi:two-component system sensor histidine kinase ChvG
VAAFAADVSHELKNPLTSMRSAVETLAFAKDKKAQAKLLAILQDDVGRLDRLITDISNVSRLDAEMSRSQMQKINLKSMMETLVDLYDVSKGDQSPLLHFEVSDKKNKQNFYISGLEGQLGQVFRNLIDNALSFSKPGGHVWVRLSKGKGMVQVIVEDEGQGIPEDKLEDIFERFYSERPKSEQFGKHSGLGLSICKQIIEAHGGAIIAENRKKIKGARFIVQLRQLPDKGKTAP